MTSTLNSLNSCNQPNEPVPPSNTLKYILKRAESLYFINKRADDELGASTDPFSECLGGRVVHFFSLKTRTPDPRGECNNIHVSIVLRDWPAGRPPSRQVAGVEATCRSCCPCTFRPEGEAVLIFPPTAR